MMAHVTLVPHLRQDLLVTRMLLNRGTLVFTAVLILGIAAWIGIQVTGGGPVRGSGRPHPYVWSGQRSRRHCA
jgi:hypothetical protein